MKHDLMSYIVCPGCAGDLSLDIFKKEETEIEEGLLLCRHCEMSYPIISGIPRILPEELLYSLVSNYGDFLARHGKAGSKSTNLSIHDTDEKIAKGFEFEWQRHSKILPEHEKEFLHVLGDVLPVEQIMDKLILDAGCGQGRFSYFMHKYGAKKVIAFDLGEQTLLAKKNLRECENVHIVQASIYHLPFKPLFNLITSIGVIHHLPEPEKGFRKLYNLLESDGKIFIWVYAYSSIIPVIRFLRKFTLNRTLRFNRMLSFFLAIPLYLINQFYNLVKIIPYFKKFADLIPFHMYHDRGFSNIWTISFDKINSSIAFYYKREDLQGWLDRLNNKKSGILSERYPGKSGSSWRLIAEKERTLIEK